MHMGEKAPGAEYVLPLVYDIINWSRPGENGTLNICWGGKYDLEDINKSSS